MTESLHDRMKRYERESAGVRLDTTLPICIRIDGRSFSKFTKKMTRPFDVDFTHAMRCTTQALVEESSALIGYTQSDEITLILYSDNPKSQVFFNGKVQKLTSVLASLAAVSFYEQLPIDYRTRLPMFDARVWNVPSKAEAANVILWRYRDAVKNSISMLASHHFSHRLLMGKTQDERLDMLRGVGVDWRHLNEAVKYGSFYRRVVEERLLTAEELAYIPEQHRPTEPVIRSEIKEFHPVPWEHLDDPVSVIFDS